MQISTIGLVLFHVVINDLNEGLENTIINLSGDKNIWVVIVHSLDESFNVQEHLDKLNRH